MKTDTTIKIVNLILNVFGLPTGLFSKVKDVISIGKDIKEQNTLSKKEKFILEITETAKSITKNEENHEDVLEKILITLADSDRFSSKQILQYFNDPSSYSQALAAYWYGSTRKDSSADGYQRAMELLLQSVYNHLPTLGVASDAEEAVLKKLYSYDALFEENNAILKELQYRGTFAEWVDQAELPASINSNIFNFCNWQIRLRGRDAELAQLHSFVKQPGISVWGITGIGGSGKSKLAREFALMEKPHRTVVWLKQVDFTKIPSFANYSYPRPILFICDYAAQFEERLKTLIERLSTKPLDVKFLLLERQQSWYTGFLSREDLICDLAVKEENAPKKTINLTNSVLDEESCRQIMTDLNFSKDGGKRRYPEKTLVPDDYPKIYHRALELSENHQSVRCLFLLLLTDAFLRDEIIQEMDADKLLENYINHSAEIIRNQYGKIADTGFLILAYATAFDGLAWDELTKSDNHACMKKYWDDIRSAFRGQQNRRSFLCRLSESECAQDIIPPLKPDLIGERLFLCEWNDCADERDAWFSELLTNEYALRFLSMCLIDWPLESKTICDKLSDQSADAEQRVHCVEVFYQAVLDAKSTAERMAYAKKINALDYDYLNAVLAKYTKALRFIVKNATKDTRTECKMLLSSVKWAHYCFETDNNQLDLAEAFSNAASIYQAVEDHVEALTYYQKALNIRERVLGTKHLDTAATYNDIAIVYKAMDDYSEALEYYKKALAIKEAILGIDHPNTALTYNNIANVYKAMDDYSEALEYYKKALAIKEAALGMDHPSTAITYNNIAWVYKAKGDYLTALEYYKKALAIHEKVQGTEHISTAKVYNNIALVYKAKGDYPTALEYYKKALAIHEKAQGTEHTSTAKSYHNIAGVYQAIGKYSLALEFYENSLRIKEKVLGPEHTSTAKTYNKIAEVYQAMGDYPKALGFYEKALAIRETVLDPEHPDTITTYENIASLYRDMGNPDKAQEYYLKAKGLFG